MESELSLASCIPLHVSHDADACLRVAGPTCPGGPASMARAPPVSLETPASLQPSLSHISAHPGKARLERVIRITVKLPFFSLHQKKSPEFGSLPWKS